MSGWFHQLGSLSAQQQDRQPLSADTRQSSIDVEDPTDALDVERPTNHDDNVDAFISAALGQLSLQERTTVYHELHGVDEPVLETPEMIQLHLIQLETFLNNLVKSLPQRDSQAYSQAVLRDSEHVRSFRLAVLRAERFDVEQAAARFLRFWDMKKRLFGEEKLCAPITLKDLNKDDRKTIRSGYMQIMPGRDRAGRAIAVLLPNFQTYKHPDNVSRCMFYMMMSILEDEETQKKGVTFVAYNVAGEDIPSKTDLRTVAAGAWMIRSLPVHMCAMHQCFDDPTVRPVINFLLRFFSEQDRARVKLHFGSHLEVVYSLMTYGMPTDLLPINLNGDLKRKNHLEFLKIRQWQEEHSEASRIVVPSQMDVLFGRGKPFRQHQGNLRLGSLVEDRLAIYLISQTKDKSNMIEEVVSKVHLEGGRFLKQDGPGMPWLEVDHQQAKEKTSQSFRTRARYGSSTSENQEGLNDGTRSSRRTFYASSETDSFAVSSSGSSPISLPEETSAACFHTTTAEYGDAKRQRY